MRISDWSSDVCSADGERQIELLATPEEVSESGIDRIGSASRIFSRYYRSETSTGTEVTQLLGEARPEWFQPLAKWDFESSKLARSEEHTSELQSLMRISYAVFCLKKKKI